MALALYGNRVSRSLSIIAAVLSVNDANRTDESVAFANDRFNEVWLGRVVT